ncbi:MAG: B12-binding domain-containing radical SAM protein [Candidatus Saccharicenans sp.]
MRKKVLLIQPPVQDFYTTAIRLYPLGLLYAARVFQMLGYRAEVLDCLNPLRQKEIPLPEKFSYLKPYLGQPYFFKRYQHFGLTVEKIIERVGEVAPDLIAISSSFAAYFSSVAELVRAIDKKYHIPIIIGGNQASWTPLEIKQRLPEIREAISGQAELSLPAFFKNESGLGVKSDFLPENGLDWKTIWPAHHLLKTGAYRIGKKNYISLQASRGCPHNCSFCNIHLLFGRQIDYRPVSSVLEEMHWNYLNRQVRLFNFEDDNLSYDRNWFAEFLSSVAKDPVLQGSELTFMNGLSYENLDEELLELMKSAGVKKLNLSWVSGDPALRRQYHRPQKKEEPEFLTLLKQAKKMGFFVTVYLILGLPGQTEEEIKEITEKLLDLEVLVGPSVFYLTPGSELQRSLNLSAEVINDWDKYRSTAFAIETEELTRDNLIKLFLYIRRRNLERRTWTLKT